MTNVIGNIDRLVVPDPKRLDNKHLWSFYIQVSGEETIQEVSVYLVGSSLDLILQRPSRVTVLTVLFSKASNIHPFSAYAEKPSLQSNANRLGDILDSCYYCSETWIFVVEG